MTRPGEGNDNCAACQKLRMHLSDIVAHIQEHVSPLTPFNLQSQCIRLDNDLHDKMLPAGILGTYELQWEVLGSDGEGLTFLFNKELLISIKGGTCQLRVFSPDDSCFGSEATFKLPRVKSDDPFAKIYFFYRFFAMIYNVVEKGTPSIRGRTYKTKITPLIAQNKEEKANLNSMIDAVRKNDDIESLKD